MTEEFTTPTTPEPTAGSLLRQAREAQGLKLDVLAQALRVAPAKLQALEADRLSELPDAMFARALTLAVCRHLKINAHPVLALLPGQDVSRLAAKNERGLDFPLDRPSFLPQSTLATLGHFFTPMRWAALMVALVALGIGWGPELRSLWALQDASTPGTVLVPVESAAVALPSTELPASSADNMTGNMVVTTVHSAAVMAQAAAQAASGASAAGASSLPGASGGGDAK